MAANGIDIGSGEAFGLLQESARTTEDDAFTIRSNAGREALGLSQQGANARTRAKGAIQTGIFTGVGTVLTSGSRVASQWQSFTQGAPAAVA
jgi:hypothetical protein